MVEGLEFSKVYIAIDFQVNKFTVYQPNSGVGKKIATATIATVY